jgi:anti-sigma regulatory factor (Ser/Thr protein kinase)
MPETSSGGFRHAMSTYAAPEEAAETAIPYLHEGITRGETLAVHVSAKVAVCLAAAEVGDELATAGVLGDVVEHPHQTLWALRQLAKEAERNGRRLRVLFEIDALANDPVDWARAETAANAALRNLPVEALCLCDVGSTDRFALADLTCAHPEVWRDGVREVNTAYIATRTHLRALDARRSPDPLEAWPATAKVPLGRVDELSQLRSALEPLLVEAGIASDRREDFLEAVFQVCVNALMHGGEQAEVRVWDTPTSVLCRVRDDGEGLSDPLMGYLPPPNGTSSPGTSLWAARQLCDHLTTTSEPEGFTVRLTVNA